MSQSLVKRSQHQLARIRRNVRPLASVAWALYRAKDEPSRDAALRGFVQWVTRKVIDGWRAKGTKSLTRFPRLFLESNPDVAARLDGTHHLGMLQDLGVAQASRLDYVLLQARNLLILKEGHPTLGLSTPILAVGGDELTALELGQLWGILLSSGHLFGTFATERGLLFHLHDRPDLRDELLEETDIRLRDHVRGILESGSIYQCCNAVASWQASRHRDPQTREVCVAALDAYNRSNKEPRRQKLQQVFRRARQFSYLQLHGQLGIGLQNVIPDELLSHVIGHPSFTYEAHAPEENELAPFFDSVDLLHYRAFFTSPSASLAVLRHLREFKRWWQCADEQAQSISTRIESLLTRPRDWPTAPDEDLSHVARIELDAAEGAWMTEVQAWHDGGLAWADANFLLTYIPNSDGLLCDVFGRSGSLSISAIGQVLSRLANHCEHSWESEPTDASRRLWRSIAAFGIAVFRGALVKGLRPVLTPTAADEGSIGYALVATSTTRALERVTYFLSRTTDPKRRQELDTLAHDLASHPREETTFVFLGAVKLFDAAGSELGDVDGLWASADADVVRWRALEVKSGNTTRGIRRQLEKLRRHLQTASSELTITASGTAKYSSTEFFQPS